jgi:osmotically-inducible protein OsmY
VNLAGTSPNNLVPFRRDADLYDEVYRAIYDYDPLRIDLPGITIHAIDGTVWLKGSVSSDLNQRLVSDQLQDITGLAEVHNELVADTDLASRVSMALGHDPRTAEQKIGVYPQLGVVRLRGNVRTPEARAAAGEIASAVPGVGRVENELHVDPHADVVPVMASVTNDEDLVPGGR